MNFEEILGRAGKLKDDAAAFIRDAHTISLTNEQLGRFRKQIVEAMQSKGIQDGEMVLEDDHIHVKGRIDKAGGGRFDADITPAGVVWKEEEHALLFEIARQNVSMDKKYKDILASSVTRITSALFGADFLNKKMGIVDAQGRIRVPLDGQSPTMDAIVGSIELKSLRCENARLFVTFQAKPKEALQNAKVLLAWWKNKLLTKKAP